MYQVKIYHYKPTYRKGDLEDETVLEDTQVFKTRKAAKEWIEGKVRSKRDVSREYHTGDKKSYVWYNTGYKWIHENSGETCYECYTYELSKIVPK